MSQTSTYGAQHRDAGCGERDVALFWPGQTISGVGTEVSRLALSLIAIGVLRASVLQTSLLSFIQSAALALALLLAGVAVERASKRPVMIGTNLGMLAMVVSIPIAALFNVLSLDQLDVVAALTGGLSAVFLVAPQAFIPGERCRSIWPAIHPATPRPTTTG